MSQTTKEEVVRILEDIANLLELQGDNPFKTRAYHSAARSLEVETGDLDEIMSSGRIDAIRGIGPAIHEKISELHKSGSLSFYETLKKNTPEGLIAINSLSGIGPKKARSLYYDLGAHSLGELEYACQENRLTRFKGFGSKTQENILKAIRFARKMSGRFLYPDALHVALSVKQVLSKVKGVKQVEIGGSVRRKRETIGDVDLIVESRAPKLVIEAFAVMTETEEIISQGDNRASVRLKSGIQADVLVVNADEFPHALHHFTGSKDHNVALRGFAKDRGFKINEYGLFQDEKRIVCENEAAIYGQLGLSFIPPEMREGMGELEWAEKGKIPNLSDLIDERHIRGLFHMHTLFSDGSASVLTMADTARAMGLEYIGISDHSQSAVYAHGLKVANIKKQHREIDALNQTFTDFRIFKGIESDIRADGSLDYDEETLESFDFVIASVHSRFKMNEQEMTDRLVKAISNPHTTMLGHMTGRLLLSREGYTIDVHRIFEAAVRHNTIIEINANPYRLDVDWRHLHMAREMGVMLAINPDAHRPEGLNDFCYGVGIARKGGLTKDDVMNTKSCKEICNMLGV